MARAKSSQKGTEVARAKSSEAFSGSFLPKCPTGIQGLDEITGGGLPRGRSTLVCGTAGCGKTMLAVEFLVRGALQYDEPGVFVSFEETEEDLIKNVASLGFDLKDLCTRKKIALDHVRVERHEIEETGDYDLEGLFIRMGHAIETVKARRVVLDTIESLFGGLSNVAVLRAELRRLFGWLKERGVTTIITGEGGAGGAGGTGALTRQGLEEYVSDCVILLDHRMRDQSSIRRLRVVKYRGSTHGTDEYPFLIDQQGISVLPITSLGLDYDASSERVSTGVRALDAMILGKGYYQGSSVLVTGSAGTGKSSLAAHFVDAACRRGELCMYAAFEESRGQIIRNMRSIGIDLAPWVEQGLLQFYTARPTLYGLEMHLATLHKLIDEFKPGIVVLDPITNLSSVGLNAEVKSMLMRLMDYMKSRRITLLFTSMISGHDSKIHSEEDISSLMDTCIVMRGIEVGGVRKRQIHILKSRGMAHSSHVRGFDLTDQGIVLTPAGRGKTAGKRVRK